MPQCKPSSSHWEEWLIQKNSFIQELKAQQHSKSQFLEEKGKKKNKKNNIH